MWERADKGHIRPYTYNKTMRNNRGFSLVEIIVSLALLAAVATILLAGVSIGGKLSARSHDIAKSGYETAKELETSIYREEGGSDSITVTVDGRNVEGILIAKSGDMGVEFKRFAPYLGGTSGVDTGETTGDDSSSFNVGGNPEYQVPVYPSFDTFYEANYDPESDTGGPNAFKVQRGTIFYVEENVANPNAPGGVIEKGYYVYGGNDHPVLKGTTIENMDASLVGNLIKINVNTPVNEMLDVSDLAIMAAQKGDIKKADGVYYICQVPNQYWAAPLDSDQWPKILIPVYN